MECSFLMMSLMVMIFNKFDQIKFPRLSRLNFKFFEFTILEGISQKFEVLPLFQLIFLTPLHVTGPSPVSPNVSQAFFAPIQPAPALLNAAANAHAQQTSNIASIVEKNRQEKLLENINKVTATCF